MCGQWGGAQRRERDPVPRLKGTESLDFSPNPVKPQDPSQDDVLNTENKSQRMTKAACHTEVTSTDGSLGEHGAPGKNQCLVGLYVSPGPCREEVARPS